LITDSENENSIEKETQKKCSAPTGGRRKQKVWETVLENPGDYGS